MSLAKRVSAMRRERGWSRWQLAQVSGLNQPRVSDIEKGVTENPRLDTLLKLAHAYGVSLDYLVQGKEPRATGGPKKDNVVSVPVLAAQDPPRREPVIPEEQHSLPAEDYKPGRRLVRLYGQSMWPDYSPGDLVLMDAGEKVASGETAVVKWAGRVVVANIEAGQDGAFVLKFSHPDWGSFEPGGSAKILGKVIKRVEGITPASLG